MSGSPTVAGVLRDVGRRPLHYLVARWHWKAALLSATLRGALFFAASIRLGLAAAGDAVAIEIAYRAATTGFFAALTQAFRNARPEWAAMLAVTTGVPAASHGLQYIVHRLRGTPDLLPAMAASVGFTVVSTAFSLYAMRRGVLIVGDADRQPLTRDLVMLPKLFAAFVAAGTRLLWRTVTRPFRAWNAAGL